MIDFIRDTQTNEILVSYTENPKKHLAALQRKSLARLESLGAIHGDHEDKLKYHIQFQNSQVKGDRFKSNIIHAVRGIIASNPVTGPPQANVIVAGERDFKDRDLLFRSLTQLHARRRIGCVNYSGDRDFERWARDWAKQNNIFERPHHPEWSTRGLIAGFKIGPRMLKAKMDAKALIVFRTEKISPSVKAMIRLAQKRGIEVVEVGAPVQQTPQPV